MKICERCQSTFDCGAQQTSSDVKDPAQKCWCFALPALHQALPFNDCLCPKCLAELTSQQTQEFDHEPDYYFDESGLMVMTRSYHLKRGSCCDSGCRHCPYKS